MMQFLVLMSCVSMMTGILIVTHLVMMIVRGSNDDTLTFSSCDGVLMEV